jgi:hypothetical protein
LVVVVVVLMPVPVVLAVRVVVVLGMVEVLVWLLNQHRHLVASALTVVLLLVRASPIMESVVAAVLEERDKTVHHPREGTVA